MSELKKICAWCKRFIGGDENSTQISHGICAECSERVFKRPPADKP